MKTLLLALPGIDEAPDGVSRFVFLRRFALRPLDLNEVSSATFKDPQLFIATPGRLLEHCQKNSADLSALKILVLDEADRMLDMGFSPDVLSIKARPGLQQQALHGPRGHLHGSLQGNSLGR